MATFVDILGQRFGKLTIVARVAPARKGRGAWWRAQCDCGGETIASGGNFRLGHNKSCGCLPRGIGGTPEGRFWKKVNVSAGPEGCWIWKGSRNPQGYGRLHFGGRHWIAHRYAVMLSTGHDPGEMKVLHRCDNPPCVNPAHLFLGTAKDNAVDRETKGRGGGQKRTGDNNGSRTRPDCRPRGDTHYFAKRRRMMAEQPESPKRSMT